MVTQNTYSQTQMKYSHTLQENNNLVQIILCVYLLYKKPWLNLESSAWWKSLNLSAFCLCCVSPAEEHHATHQPPDQPWHQRVSHPVFNSSCCLFSTLCLRITDPHQILLPLNSCMCSLTFCFKIASLYPGVRSLRDDIDLSDIYIMKLQTTWTLLALRGKWK